MGRSCEELKLQLQLQLGSVGRMFQGGRGAKKRVCPFETGLMQVGVRILGCCFRCHCRTRVRGQCIACLNQHRSVMMDDCLLEDFGWSRIWERYWALVYLLDSLLEH